LRGSEECRHLTVKPKCHFGLEHFEIFRHRCLGFGAHLLACPLEGAIKLLSDVHGGGLVEGLQSGVYELEGETLMRICYGAVE
jgi:hypothetical protein